MYLIDTDVVIDLLNGRDPATEFFATELAEARVSISTVTVGELYAGVDPNDYPERSLARIEHFLLVSAFEVIPLTAESARMAGLLSGSLTSVGTKTGLLDLFNAAIALEFGFVVVTRNVRHYGRVPNLKIVSPAET